MGFLVTYERLGAATIASLTGEVDAKSGRRARTQLLASLKAGRSGPPRLLVVDLSGATFVDSWGFGILVAAARQARAIACTFCLVAPTGMIASVLAMTGLDKSWPIYPTTQAALDTELAGPQHRHRLDTANAAGFATLLRLAESGGGVATWQDPSAGPPTRR